jgi:uncharacterized membrane protein YedE/YeeE
MTIDWMHFTPWLSLAGGAMLGAASAMFILFNGRIAGISGIVGGLLHPLKGDRTWRLAFIAGLVASPLVYGVFAAMPEIRIEASPLVLIAAGLCVGIGTRYGAGCTSGHGICGLSRFSLRSLVATLSFMATGFATVFVVRHLLK